METIKLALVDDHKMFRDGIKSVLSVEKDIKIIAEFGSAEEFVEFALTKDVNILLTDISLPLMSGIDLCKYIKENYPEIKVIILSMHTNEEFVMKALNNGASGYLPKESGHEELISAIRKVSQNEIYFNHSISQTIIKGVTRKDKSENQNPYDLLSSREIEVLKFFAEGFTNGEIAEKLFISVRTVESHKTHIIQKMGLKSNVDLVKLAIKHKIISL